KPACVKVASRIVLGDENVPSLCQISQRRGVAVIRLLVDQERHFLRQPLPILPFPKTQFLERGHVFGAAENLGVCPFSNLPSQEAETATSGLAAVAAFRCRFVLR